MKQIFLCATLVLSCMTFSAQHAEAATAHIGLAPQSSWTVTPGNIVYDIIPKKGIMVITYTLKAFGGDMYIPAIAQRKIGSGAVGRGGIEYAVLDDAGAETAGGVTYGALLSTSTIVDGTYKIPNGTSREFTLAVLFDNTGNASGSYRIALDRNRFQTSASDTTEKSDDISSQKKWSRPLRLSK